MNPPEHPGLDVIEPREITFTYKDVIVVVEGGVYSH